MGWDISVGWSVRVRIAVTAITFSWTAIHSPTVYNLQHDQGPVPLIPRLYGVGD